MFTLQLVLPLVALVLVGALLSWQHARVHLQVSVLTSTATLFVGALATLPLVGHFLFGGVLELPFLGRPLHDILHPDGSHLSANVFVSLAAMVWLGIAVVRIRRLFRSRRASRTNQQGGVTTIETSEPMAYVVPGGSRTIVVSRGLVESLTPIEIEVVMAHEEAHARFRHDRLLLVGHLAVAIMPLLYPVLRWLEFSLERIADESAATVCGDRRLVARTLAKVALSRQPAPLAPAIARMGTAARVRHLVEGQQRVSIAVSSFTLLCVAPLALLAVIQWHHVVLAIRHVCGW